MIAGTIMHSSSSDLRELLLEGLSSATPAQMLETFPAVRSRSDVLHRPDCDTAEDLLPDEAFFCALEVVCEWRRIAPCCASWELARRAGILSAALPSERLALASSVMELRLLAAILSRWLETAPVPGESDRGSGLSDSGYADSEDSEDEIPYLVSPSQAAGVLMEIVEATARLRLLSVSDALFAPSVVTLLRRCRSLTLAELVRLGSAPDAAWRPFRTDLALDERTLLRMVSDALLAPALARPRTLVVVPLTRLPERFSLSLLALVSTEVFALPSMLLLEADAGLVAALAQAGEPVFSMPSGFSLARPGWVSEVSLTLQILDRPGLEALSPQEGSERLLAALTAALAALSS